MTGVPRPAAVRSPVGRMILIGERIVAQVVAGGTCPFLFCQGTNGEHVRECLVGEALKFDPAVRRQLAGGEADRG